MNLFKDKNVLVTETSRIMWDYNGKKSCYN